MLVVNLYGAPSAGKSTIRADVFRRLKMAGVNCEEITEAAKRYTWQKRHMSLACQPYLFGKQLHETEVLKGQVDVVITDSPLILCCLYGRMNGGRYPESFYQSIVDISNGMKTMDYYLNRVNPYNPVGRGQDEAQSNKVGEDLIDLLDSLKIDYKRLDGNEMAAAVIAQHVLERLAVDQIFNFFQLEEK